jgi:hypothetical protein
MINSGRTARENKRKTCLPAGLVSAKGIEPLNNGLKGQSPERQRIPEPTTAPVTQTACIEGRDMHMETPWPLQ